MNKKFLNIVLIVLMLIIWGGVFKKFLWNSNEPAETPTEYDQTFELIIEAEKDRLEFHIENTNPFGVSELRTKNPITPAPGPVLKSRKSVRVSKRITGPWPDITYHGFVKNENSTNRLILLKINGKLIKIKENEEVLGLEIEKVRNDSIVVKRDKETRIIGKYY